MTSTQSHDQVLSEWNDTARPIPALTLVELFEAEATRNPDAEAVVSEDVTLTYRQFHAAVHRLAHRLIARGAAAERFVALALPRSAEFLVAAHAVVKAGAAYLPIEPGLPDERIRRMIADADPVCIVTTVDIAPRLSADAPRLVVAGEDLTGDPSGDGGLDDPGSPQSLTPLG